MISEELGAALDSACSGEDIRVSVWHKRKGISRERLEFLLLNIMRDLPDDMTVRDIREQLGG